MQMEASERTAYDVAPNILRGGVAVIGPSVTGTAVVSEVDIVCLSIRPWAKTGD